MIKIDKTKINKWVKISSVITGVIFMLALVWGWEVFVPKSFSAKSAVVYDAKKGLGDEEIAKELKKLGIIRSELAFRLYTFITGNDDRLQAGKYNLSPSMPIAQIVRKMASGDIVKYKLTIKEGWDLQDIGKYLEKEGVCSADYFLYLARQDYSKEFDFLNPPVGGKPKELGLEGYVFPDTYEIAAGEDPKDLVMMILENFGKKLTSELRQEIAKQEKTVFEIITMASIIEKEVRTMADQKIVSGILWKRIASGMPLQVDATVNYITGKNHASVLIKDTKIDSPYNTYKYKGLPLGPISNPGIDSILAAIYPKASPYWYYLSANGSGKTIFSKTFYDHQVARSVYLRGY